MGGQLLSGNTLVDGRVEIQCKRGHIFRPLISNLLRKRKPTWCPEQPCLGERISKSKVDPIKEQLIGNLEAAIVKNGGRWVDGDYINNRTEIYIDCGKGHKRVPIKPQSILAGSWCRECDPTKRSKEEILLELKALAVDRNGELLSDKYIDAKSKLVWKCNQCGSEWQASPDSVKGGGSWCPSCNSGVALDGDVYEKRAMRAVSEVGGTFQKLERRKESATKSTIYVHYICEVGHTNIVRLYTLEQGHGCNTCNLRGVSETICRAVFEHLFEVPFPKTKPDWLINDIGNKLELDGYSQELGLAFEYQGQQHYEFLPFFHKSREDFETRLSWDEYKRQQCQHQGVQLLEIPYWIDLGEIQDFIIARLSKTLRNLIKNKSELDVSTVQTGRQDELNRLRCIATNRGGRLISEVYFNSQSPLLWHCGNDKHPPWTAVPGSIVQGTWCRQCANEELSQKRRTPITVIDELLAVRQWQLLEVQSDSVPIKYLVKCGNNHQFTTDLGRLKKPLGCQKCGKLITGRKYALSIEALAEAANLKSGTLISKHYINNRQKMIWRCGHQHYWQATANNILQAKSWCPVCSSKKRSLSIERVKELIQAEEALFQQLNTQLSHAYHIQEAIRESFG